MSDDTWQKLHKHESTDDAVKELRDRVVNMERYIYDIKVVQSFIPQIKSDIESNKNDIAQLKLDVRGLRHAVDKMLFIDARRPGK